jgi:inner membrane protein
MDNLAHTLVGAALGRAVADRRAPMPALVGAIAANAPDWSEFFVGFHGRRIEYYSMHRGITHSFLGAAVETIGLTVLVWLLATAWSRRRRTAAPSWRWIALCVGTTVLSHLYMDWQGSYGLRPFLPWSERWYYADWVAIVDPFFWVAPLLALAWGSPRHWRPALVILAPTTVLVLFVAGHLDQTPGWVRLLLPLSLAIGAVGWMRHWFGVALRQRVAAWSVLLLGGYAVAQGLASVPAKAAAHRIALARFGPDAQAAALTRVGHPFRWELVYASPDTVAGAGWQLPRHLSDPRVQRALATPEGQALARFARFLAAEVDSESDGVTVVLRDARYARTQRDGWGVVRIRMAGD